MTKAGFTAAEYNTNPVSITKDEVPIDPLHMNADFGAAALRLFFETADVAGAKPVNTLNAG